MVRASAHSRRQALCSLSAGLATVSLTGAAPAAEGDGVFAFDVEQFGERVSMSKYKGKALVIVNVASE